MEIELPTYNFIFIGENVASSPLFKKLESMTENKDEYYFYLTKGSRKIRFKLRQASLSQYKSIRGFDVYFFTDRVQDSEHYASFWCFDEVGNYKPTPFLFFDTPIPEVYHLHLNCYYLLK